MSTRSEQEAGAGVATRKRLRQRDATPLDMTEASTSSESSALQVALREIQQLHAERVRQQEEFQAQLRRRDEMLRGMEERLRRMDEIQLSRNNLRENERVPIRIASADDLDTRESISKELGFKLKPDTFDGTGSIREFFVQFNLIAKASSWSEKTKTVALASCLRGKARSVLDCVSEIDNLRFIDLKSKLELQFGDSYLSATYYTQFTNRRQKFGENLSDLGADIDRLSRLAYSECSDEVREKIACAQFINAINDRFVKRTLQLEGITSLKLAIERAKTIREINENSFFEKDKKIGEKFKGNRNRNYEIERKEGNFQNKEENKNKKIEKGTNYFKNGNFNKNYSQKEKECWQCGKSGHFRAECPILMNEKKQTN